MNKNTNQRRQELELNYGFYCTCDRCEGDDIADPFMEKYVCNRFSCGGLLVKQLDGNSNNNNKKHSNRKDSYIPKICHKCGEPAEEEDEYY